MAKLLSVTVAAAAFLCISMPAFADTHVAYVDAAGQPGMQLYVKDGKVRMEMGTPGNPIGIFDTVNNVLIVIKPDTKTYYLFDQQTAAHLGKQFQDAQAQLDKATKKVENASEKLADKLTTVAQHGFLQTLVAHALIDYAVKLMIPSGFAMTVELKQLGTTETVAGYSCTDEQVIINGNPGETRCVVADTSKLPIPAADIQTLQTMSDDFRVILLAIEPMAHGISNTMATGLPIRDQKMTYDQATRKLGSRVDTLQAITTTTLSAELFAAPKDYTQTSLEDIGQP
jgi:hypothetical protein